MGMVRTISEDDCKMINKVRAIAEKGSNAEVKLKDGAWVVYEVKKIKHKVE